MSVPNLTNMVNSVFSYHTDKGWSIYQFVDGHCDLDLRPNDLKIHRDHLHLETHVCAKFDKPRSILCLVIIQTRKGLPTDRWIDGPTDRHEQSNIPPLR